MQDRQPELDAVRATLRRWAIAEAIGGLVLAAITIALIPWKTPAINALLCAYAALHLAAGHGLWRAHRLGHRLAVAGGLIGLALGVAVVTALLASWAYLHGTFGDFGLGASIAALLFAGVGVQALVFYPALKLTSLLRAPVRAAMATGRAPARAAAALLLIPPLVALAVHLRHDLDVIDPVPADARTQALAHLRAALTGAPRPPLDALRAHPVGPGPLTVSWYHRGKLRARVTADGDDLAAAVARAADSLADHPDIRGRRALRGRLKIDRVVGATPLLSEHIPVVALSVNPGQDGLRRAGEDGTRTLLPDDLVAAQRFGHAPLVPGIRELRLGLDAAAVLARLQGQGRLERLRTESWIEPAEGPGMLPVVRGNTPLGATGPAAWRHAAIEGGDFVLRQIRDDGRFHYQYHPLRDRHSTGAEYSIPRHAGTVYSLALLYGLTGHDRFKTGAEAAMRWLVERLPPECGAPDRTCVPDGDWAVLGSAALTLVGMLEYQRRTGDARYAEPARRLAAFIRALQRADGDFDHKYHVATGALDRDARLMFYSEEAALALVMAHKVLGDTESLAAAERALDHLTGPKYSRYFLGWFIYGADHWTCIAAEEAWPTLAKRDYLDFCAGYADFVARLQYDGAWWDNADFDGHYGFSGLMVPQAPGAAGFSEAIVSTAALARHHRDPDLAAALDAQIAPALDALAREQIRPDNAWLMPDPAAARGGIRRSLVEAEVRIDFTQHALSALIRGAELHAPTPDAG
ncbi:MAG: hypothetical protein H6705_15085 [Myxococcales bacterium]|nr:hypothetical protein [Myxococcales bacterium]